MGSLDISALIFPAMLVISAALLGGGFVIYRQSKIVGWRAVAMAAMASGIALIVFTTFAYPITRTGTTAEPQVVTEPVSNQQN